MCFGLGYPLRYPFLSLDIPLVGFGRVVVFRHGERERGVGQRAGEGIKDERGTC